MMMVPLVSSGTKGPLGAAHLPRLWLKISLAAQGQLPADYDECGHGFDQMTLDSLSLDRDETIAYIRSAHPTYMEFEHWVLERNGGYIDPERINRHNDAIHGYHHSDELGSTIRAATGIPHAHVKDAVTLNIVEDLDVFHRELHKR